MLDTIMLKQLHGMLKVLPLCYKKIAPDIKDIEFVINQHDAGVANKISTNKQHALTWHEDDVKYVHVSPKVNDEFDIWCKEKYGNDYLGHIKVTR